jgi:hypothetical protein
MGTAGLHTMQSAVEVFAEIHASLPSRRAMSAA